MLQSRESSMQGYNEDCLPMKGHTQGRMHPQCYQLNGHTEGGRTQNFLDTHTNRQNGQSRILRQHAA